MFPVKQSTSLAITFFAFDSNGDGVTGKVDGDWTKRISKNGAAFAAMTVTVSEMENGWYSLTLSSSHTDTLGILSLSFSATGVKRVNLQYRVHVREYDDLAFPTTSGRSLDVTATGAAGIDWGNIENTSTAQNLSATNIDVDQIVASVSGNVSGSVGSVATGGITSGSFAAGAIDAAAIAADAIGSSELAASAVTEIQSGLSTLSAAQVNAEVDTALADVGVTTTVTGRIDVAISSRLASASYTTPPTATENADALLARDLGSGTGAGTLDERTVRSALRFNRNKFTIAGSVLTVYKEDDTTVAFTAAITTTAGNPVSASDPT